MKIELKEISVRELTEGYVDNNHDGVVGYNGKLDIRPSYQREFIYNEKERNAVLDTLKKYFPLNVMYWSVRENGYYEVIDGQQRTISICQYVRGDFSIDGMGFFNLQADEKERILDYTLMIYFCSGTDSERLDWFRTINIAGKVLSNQELRNAVYSGTWVTEAKRYFAKNDRPRIGDDYLSGSPIRQEYLETVIKWISSNDIEGYMSTHQHDENVTELWNYFTNVITWIQQTFIVRRTRFMKGVDCGTLYNKYKDEILDAEELETKTIQLIADDDVVNKKGIYPFLLTNKEKYLNVRAFTDSMKQKVFEQQEKVCLECKEEFEIHQMEGDHKVPWSEGGKTIEENCQMLCVSCNREKGAR